MSIYWNVECCEEQMSTPASVRSEPNIDIYSWRYSIGLTKWIMVFLVRRFFEWKQKFTRRLIYSLNFSLNPLRNSECYYCWSFFFLCFFCFPIFILSRAKNNKTNLSTLYFIALVSWIVCMVDGEKKWA